MAKLFMYTITYHPKVTKDRNGNETQGPDLILQQPKYVMAEKESVVRMIAAREIDAKYAKELDRVEIIVRPY